MISTAEPQITRSLSVVIPVYNSQDTIVPLIDALVDTLTDHFEHLEIIAVNDGSLDLSHEYLVKARKKHSGVLTYVRLAKNFGEHNAVMCGLRHSTFDAIAIIDDDFQNPPSEILKLTDKLQEGYDVVYSSYTTKYHERWRNLGSRINDWVASKLLDKPKGLYLSSFKVMNRFLVNTVVEYNGPFPYLDGLILRTTDSIGTQLCEHRQRQVGRSNYTVQRLLRLWLNMVTNFSVVPLRVSMFLGIFMCAVGMFLSIFFVISWSVGGIFFHGTIPPGWASTIVLFTTFSGIQLLMIGLIGEYLGRVFLTNNLHPQAIPREVHLRDRS